MIDNLVDHRIGKQAEELSTPFDPDSFEVESEVG